MSLTGYISTCDGGTKPTRTPGDCPESSRILGFALFKTGFDIQAFFDSSGGTPLAMDKAQWDALEASGDLCYLVKDAGGDLVEPTANTVTDLRRNPRLVDFTHAIPVQMYKYEGNELVVDYLNDNTFGLIIFTEDKKAHVFVDKVNRFIKASAVASAINVDGEMRVQATFNLTDKKAHQVQDVAVDLLD